MIPEWLQIASVMLGPAIAASTLSFTRRDHTEQRRVAAVSAQAQENANLIQDNAALRLRLKDAKEENAQVRNEMQATLSQKDRRIRELEGLFADAALRLQSMQVDLSQTQHRMDVGQKGAP